MRIALYFIACLLLHSIASAQTVPSSCSAPDSIVKKYITDADYMAHARMLQTNYIDSIEIPQSWTDTTLHALVAVYNATALPARDSIVKLREIHNLNTDWLTNLFLVADSMAGYMDQMQSNTFPTGFAPFDDLMTKYHFQLKYYIPSGQQAPPDAHTLFLVSDSSYNMAAMADSFEALPNAYLSGPAFTSFTSDSMAISDTLNPTYIALDYRYSWDDCDNGCKFHHVWHFRVPYTCDSVIYIGSSGDPLPVSVQDAKVLATSVYPNPAKDILMIAGLKSELQFTIYSLYGQTVLNGKTNGIISVNGLQTGFYFLRLSSDGAQTTVKFFKE